ncbi:MAG: FmdB family zinc ribbon protein [Anaerolineae bacterium]|jgi:putative FmdB family regulatory protein
MPVYEYRCGGCGRKMTIWWRSVAQMERSRPSCTRCGSEELRRLVSRVAVVRSEEARLDSLADGMMDGFDEGDPRALGRMMRQLGQEAGEDLGEEFDEIVGRLEAGEDPEEIERSMPGLAGDDSGYESGDAFDPDL